MHLSCRQWVGTGGQEPGRKGAGGGRRERGKQESQGGGNRETLRNILFYFAIKIGQRGGNHYRKGQEVGEKVKGRGRRGYGKQKF